MKKQSISTYIIALLTLSSWLLPVHLHAQEKLFQGVKVGVDVFGPLSQVLGSDSHNSEAHVAVNLKNRFFPIVDLGSLYAYRDGLQRVLQKAAFAGIFHGGCTLWFFFFQV